MDYFRNYFGDTRQFGNWQQYAGMPTDRTFQSQGVAPPQQTPGAAPSSFAEMGQQMVDRFQTNVGNVGTNLSNAANQFSQGNVLNAVRSVGGSGIASAVPPGAPKPPAAPGVVQQPVVDDYDYTSRVGQ